MIMTIDQIIKLQTSDDYKERMIAEYQLLKRRFEKLKKMVDDYFHGKLNFTLDCPIALFDMQLEVMAKYLDILVIRAKIEGVNLDG